MVPCLGPYIVIVLKPFQIVKYFLRFPILFRRCLHTLDCMRNNHALSTYSDVYIDAYNVITNPKNAHMCAENNALALTALDQIGGLHPQFPPFISTTLQ